MISKNFSLESSQHFLKKINCIEARQNYLCIAGDITPFSQIDRAMPSRVFLRA